MKSLIKENTWLTRGSILDFGWGNGYVLIPEGHPLHGKHYDDIDVSVHGGLTFSELVDSDMVTEWGLEKTDEGAWCVGFDTAHWGDSLSNWSVNRVHQETVNLLEQLKSI